MRTFLLILVLLFFSHQVMASDSCEIDGKIVSSSQACAAIKKRERIEHETELGKTGAKKADDTKKEKILSREELKREMAEERLRQKAKEKARIKQKRCAYLEEKMIVASEEAKMATGRNLEIAERHSRRATEKYVLECPK
jgi:hypothetical protein